MTHLRLLRNLFSAAKKSAVAFVITTVIAAAAAGQTNTFPSSGNAGIGTTSPGDALHIVKDNGGLTLDTVTTGTIVPVFRFSTTGTGRASIQYRPDLPGLAFQTGGVAYPTQNRMVLTDSGNVGIGTNNPNAKFVVASGNVGLGTNDIETWTQQSSVIESLNTSIFFGQVKDLHANSNAYHNAGWKYKSSGTAANYYLYNGIHAWRVAPSGAADAPITWVDAMTLNNSGNLGIGTTAPINKLHVAQSSGQTNYAMTNVADLSLVLQNTSNTANNFEIISFVNSVGAGVAHIGAINQSHSTAAGQLFFATRPPNSGMVQRMLIDQNGNVGIGTLAPGYRLDVNGEVNATGLRINGVPISTGGSGAVSSVFGRTGAVVAASNDYTWAQINKTTSSLADLTTRSAFDLSSGTLPDARFPATLPALSGANLTSLNATNLSSGTVAPPRLGSGTANSTTFLRGDNTWAAVTSSQWANGSGNINFTGGNVGIGTASPQRTLDLGTSGQLTFGNNGYSSSSSPGLFWYSDDINYGIYKSAGSWSAPNYQQLTMNFSTGIVIDGGSSYGKSGTILQPNGGNVGIGTTSPGSSYKLDVNGNINSNATITGNNIAAKYQDLAEWVPSSEQLSAGTVVVLDTTKSNQVISATVAYDTRVAGVISAQPGITLGESGEGKVLVATTGRVRVKVDASRGPIQIGDLLVTSDVPGVAMKSEPVEFAGRKMHMPGTIIGKALEPLAKGSGEILVLLSLQ